MKLTEHQEHMEFVGMSQAAAIGIFLWGIVFLLILAFCAPAQAGVYIPVSGGMVRYGSMPDGTWWESDHRNTQNYNSIFFSAGLGYEVNDKWSFEVNYRYLYGGKIDADLEYDTTWKVPGADHTVVERTVSTWGLQGISANALYSFGKPYVRLAIFDMHSWWNVKTVYFDHIGLADTTYHDNRLRPLFGAGWKVNDCLSIEAIYYPQLNTTNTAIRDAVTLGIVGRF